MARPRKNSAEPPVKERIKSAFWELYKTRSLEQIGVKEICGAAHCNKTTFYYHYTCTAQVLEEIENECLLLDLPKFLVGLLGKDTFDKQAITLYAQENGTRIETIRALLGPNGDPSFKCAMEEKLIECWCSAMEINQEALEPDDRLFLRYSMGGTVGLVAHDPSQGDEPLDFEALYRLAADAILPRVKRMISHYGG